MTFVFSHWRFGYLYMCVIISVVKIWTDYYQMILCKLLNIQVFREQTTGYIFPGLQRKKAMELNQQALTEVMQVSQGNPTNQISVNLADKDNNLAFLGNAVSLWAIKAQWARLSRADFIRLSSDGVWMPLSISEQTSWKRSGVGLTVITQIHHFYHVSERRSYLVRLVFGGHDIYRGVLRQCQASSALWRWPDGPGRRLPDKTAPLPPCNMPFLKPRKLMRFFGGFFTFNFKINK